MDAEPSIFSLVSNEPATVEQSPIDVDLESAFQEKKFVPQDMVGNEITKRQAMRQSFLTAVSLRITVTSAPQFTQGLGVSKSTGG
jgi:hypothetical protein